MGRGIIEKDVYFIKKIKVSLVQSMENGGGLVLASKATHLRGPRPLQQMLASTWPAPCSRQPLDVCSCNLTII